MPSKSALSLRALFADLTHSGELKRGVVFNVQLTRCFEHSPQIKTRHFYFVQKPTSLLSIDNICKHKIVMSPFKDIRKLRDFPNKRRIDEWAIHDESKRNQSLRSYSEASR